jgi:hypothetical protein
MGIRIELDSDTCDARDWRALAAFALEMEKAAPEPVRQDVVYGFGSNGSNSEKLIASFKAAPPPPPVHVTPVDNPSTGVDPELAGFLPNAPGGTATVVPDAAVPAAFSAPPPPPAMPPAPPAAGTAPATNGVLLDVNKLPWDYRIHASTKTQNANGTWRYKRGVDDAEIARVEGELRSVMSLSPPLPLPPPDPSVPSTVAVDGFTPPPREPMTFTRLMPKVTGAIKSGTLTQEHVNAVLQKYGFPHLPAVAQRPDLLPHIHGEIFP